MDNPAAPSCPSVYEFDEFRFDAATGELTRLSADEHDESRDETIVASSRRLPPQPARLLTLLLQSDGALLSREHIRQALWPDVEVEFDQGLHFCVRQIRSALGDSAASPRFIETLPRRGYRWMTPVRIVDDPCISDDVPLLVTCPSANSVTDSAAGTLSEFDATSNRSEHASSSSTDAAGISRSANLIVVVAALFVIALTIWVVVAQSGAPSLTRIAIMPFAPPTDGSITADTRQIATQLLARLTDENELGVIGPLTTEQFTSSATPLRDLHAATDAEFIINARFGKHEGQMQMLAELVRTSDGVHVWVRWFANLHDLDAITQTIAGNIIAHVARSTNDDESATTQ